MKKLFTVCLVLCLLLGVSCAETQGTTTVQEIQKYGNLVLSIDGSELLNVGYTYGDIIEVEINGSTLTMPVGTSYTDVDEGELVCRVVIDEENGADEVIMAINMSDLATTLGIAVKTKQEEEPGYHWDMLVAEPVEVRFAMKEAGGYLNEYLIRRLVRTNERSDYAHLSDEAFANFRNIATTGMGEGVLYRSSSPVNPELNRNAFADAAVKAAGIRTVVNLANSQTVMQSYEGFAQSAYAACNVMPLNLGIDFMAKDFQNGLAQGLRFMTENKGPYLVHCDEGKDCAGFVSALLECFMGASAQEVVEDYMITYANYYGVEKDTEQYQAIAESNIVHTLQSAFEVSDLYQAELAAEAEAYLAEKLQLTQEEITALRLCLAGE